MNTKNTQHDYDKLLLQAVDNNDIEAVNSILPFLPFANDFSSQTFRTVEKAIQLGHLDIVQTLLPVVDPTLENSFLLQWAAECGQLPIVECLLPASNSTDYSKALGSATGEGHFDVVKLLVPFIDPKELLEPLYLSAMCNRRKIFKFILPLVDCSANNSYALRLAARFGFSDVIQDLIPKSDPKAENSEALRWAVKNGHIKIVNLLLEHSDPKANNSEALRCAAGAGNTELVELLIPGSDPKARDSQALKLAVWDRHTKCVKLLIPVSDAKTNNSQALKIAVSNRNEEIINQDVQQNPNANKRKI